MLLAETKCEFDNKTKIKKINNANKENRTLDKGENLEVFIILHLEHNLNFEKQSL